MHHHDPTLPLLDLHGLHRTDAVRAVTNFLENHHHTRRQVCIVTGTGSHSQRGPVLRSAVEELLRKREMEYERETPGSFLVRTGTGIVLSHQASTEQDTKLIFRDRDEGSSLNSLPCSGIQRTVGLGSRRGLSQRRTSPSVQSALHFGPSPSEVVSNDAELEQVRQESLHTHRVELQKQNVEKRELDLALHLSLVAQEDEETKFSESMRLALHESEIKAASEDDQEKQTVERVILQSITEYDQNTRLLSDDELESTLREALELSLRSDQGGRGMGDEEEELKKVLESSLQS